MVPELLPLDTSDISSNAWLAGFIEGSGNFYIRTTKNSNRIRVSFEFSFMRGRNEIFQNI
jgi:hypothetical protein